MNATMKHRGPDGDGYLIDGEVGLGHRRLSIIDLAGGSQPIGNEDGNLQVVFNGEIYNHVELRIELESLNHRFVTQSDTEVIVHAYEEWGQKCVNRFNGMFAFAIWDRRARELFIARDHLGIKPLYYYHSGRQLLFASEIKALLRHEDVPNALDIDSLAQLFTFRFVPSPRTLFQGILKLPPGHMMLVGRRGITVERFWKTIPSPQNGADEQELIEEYQWLLEDAVKLQLRSDVPLGLFLSSGIDSGVLLSIMSATGVKPVNTFTIGFEDGEETNEVKEAEQLARMFGAEHTSQTLSSRDYAEYYSRYMQDIEEPVGNETAAAFYFVSKLASQSVTVALSGQGADEPWAGYDRHKGIRFSELYSRLPRPVTRSIGALVSQLPGRMERLKRGAYSLAEPDVLTRITMVYSFFTDEMKQHLFTGALKQNSEQDPGGPRKAISHLQQDVRHLDPLTQMLYIDTRASLPDDLLMVGDKTSMACSLESRVPFLDYRLVEFIERLPAHLKLRGLTGKYLHKKASLKWLPREVVYRPKKGFANPVQKWFRTSMKEMVHDCLLGSDSGMTQYFDREYLKRIVEDDASGREPYRRHLYLLVSLELWHRAFMGSHSVN